MSTQSHSENEVAVVERRRGLNLRGVLQITVGITALAIVILRSDARGLAEAIRATRVSLLPLAVLATVMVNWLMAYRWGLILRVRGHRINTNRLFVYYLIGIFFSNFVPGGSVSGDVARLVYVDREIHDKAFVLSTLVYERTVGLFVLLLIGLGAMVASHGRLPEGRLIYLGEALLALAFLALSLLMSDYVSSRLARLFRWMGGRFKTGRFKTGRFKAERLGEAASRTLEAISELRKYPWMLVSTVLVSVLIRVVWSLGCYVVAEAMGLPLGLPLIFAFISLVDLIRMMPISVGGLGVREWALIVLFAGAGIAREQALMFSFLAFAPILLNAIAGGFIYISRADLVRTERPIRDVTAKGVEV